MTKFIFFGRLEREKGIDMILDVFPKLYINGITDRTLSIYGSGNYSEACKAAAEAFPNNITFHGRGDQKIIFAEVSQSDFCLMPSRVIETFGLSALESLRYGTPVIGFKKGGLENFIIDELDIFKASGESRTDKLYSLVHDICTKHTSKNDLPIGPEQLSLSNYTPDSWLDSFKKIAGDAKKILIVSDFIKRVGGIESYIWDVKDLLAHHGYTVEMQGTNKSPSHGRLIKTALNISAWRKLRQVISRFQPDIVWVHSVVRELGRLPLTAIPKNTKTLMMFHDMGYFVPYPSRLYNIRKVADRMTLGYWLKTGGIKTPLKIVLLSLKRLSLRLIRGVFRRHLTTYLVPSEFMKEPVEKWRAGKTQQILVLPHFVKTD